MSCLVLESDKVWVERTVSFMEYKDALAYAMDNMYDIRCIRDSCILAGTYQIVILK